MTTGGKIAGPKMMPAAGRSQPRAGIVAGLAILFVSVAAYGQTPTNTPTRTPTRTHTPTRTVTATMTISPTPGATPTCGATMRLAIGYCSADEWGHSLCIDGGCSDTTPYCANDGDCSDTDFPICSGDGSNDFEVQSNTDTDPWGPVFAACNGTNAITSVRQGTGGFGQSYSGLILFRNPGFNGTVTGATLRLQIGTVVNEDGRNLQGEYFEWSPTCGAEDFTTSGGNDAFTDAIVDGVGGGWEATSRNFALSNVNLIDPADDVELRISIDGGNNDGSNRVDYVTHEHAFAAGPLLLLNVDCSVPTPTNTPANTPTPGPTSTPGVALPDALQFPSSSWEVDGAARGCKENQTFRLEDAHAELTFCGTGGAFEGHARMSDAWPGGPVNLSVTSINASRTAVTATVSGVFECQCVNDGEAPGAWGTAAPWSIAFSAAAAGTHQHSVTPDNTCSGTCGGGSWLYWRGTVKLQGSPPALSLATVQLALSDYPTSDAVTFNAGSLEPDEGAGGCAPAVAIARVGGPRSRVIYCAGTAGQVDGGMQMPDTWDGTPVPISFTAVSGIGLSATSSGSFAGKAVCQCVAAGGNVSSTWGSPAAFGAAWVGADPWAHHNAEALPTCSGTCGGGAWMFFRGTVESFSDPRATALLGARLSVVP